MDDSTTMPPASVLVVDDDLQNLKLLEGLLSKRGYTVRLLSHGQLALRSAQANVPDVVLLDIRLPDMDGYAVCEALKANAQTCDVPVIFCSALEESFDKVRAFAAGGVDYITKPFDAEEMLARLATHVALRQMQRQLRQQNDQLRLEVAERMRTEFELHQRVAELSALNHIAEALTQWIDLPAALRTVGAALAELFEQANVAIWVRDEASATLRCLAVVSEDQATMGGPAVALADDPVAARVLSGRRPKILAPAARLPLVARPPQLPTDGHAGGCMMVPLLSGGGAIGVLCIQAAPPERMYTPADVALAQTIASTLASAIENARLFMAEQRQRQAAESLREVTTALTASLDLETVVRKIFEQLGRVVRYDGAAIFLADGDALVIWKGAGLGEPHVGRRLPLSEADPTVDVFLNRRPRIIDDTSACADWTDWDGWNIPLSWMGAPLVIGGASLGVLSTDHFATHVYGAEDLRTLETFAHQAAIAIENARLFVQAQAAATEEERKRLARELHDSVSQALYMANLNAEVIPQLWEQDPNKGRRALNNLHQFTRSALAEMHMLLIELRPNTLVRTPLHELLETLGTAVSAKYALAVDTQLDPAPIFPEEVQVALYRIVQEALNNVVKHAQAQRVNLLLQITSLPAASQLLQQVRLRVVDDGRGFEVARAAAGRLGLGGMRERAAGIGASLRISSRPGAGTCVLMRWRGRAAAAKERA